MEHWYALHTKPWQEHQACDYLCGRNIEVYMPTLRPAGKRGRRDREQPLFARYLFVRGDLNQQPGVFERNRALKLDLDGRILAKWGSFGSYDGQFYWAHDIAAGPGGEVYVGDVYWGMRVQKFVPAR
ncbi:MAG: hypothetical protein K6U89_19465 [Chloroflexi bacterium]|nr:hypothetical protein [Chloroflexota bacterium]